MRPQQRMWPFAMKSVDAGGVKCAECRWMKCKGKGKRWETLWRVSLLALYLHSAWLFLPHTFCCFCFLCFTLLRFGFFCLTPVLGLTLCASHLVSTFLSLPHSWFRSGFLASQLSWNWFFFPHSLSWLGFICLKTDVGLTLYDSNLSQIWFIRLVICPRFALSVPECVKCS